LNFQLANVGWWLVGHEVVRRVQELDLFPDAVRGRDHAGQDVVGNIEEF